MKKSLIVLFITTCTIASHGQFFSEDEKAEIRNEKKVELKTELPEKEQMAVYMELCAALKKAESKATQFHPVKIHHTPEQRAQQDKKRDTAKDKLFGRYKKDLASQHQITEELLEKIDAAGKEKKWPTAKELPKEE
jgi:hypothetical protein